MAKKPAPQITCLYAPEGPTAAELLNGCFTQFLDRELPGAWKRLQTETSCKQEPGGLTGEKRDAAEHR